MIDPVKFWSKLAPKYAKTPIKNQAAYQAKLDITQSFFTPQTRLLEVGCGTGTTALYHAPHVAAVLATDISPAMLDIARDKQSATGIDNVRFEELNLDVDPIAETDFDVAMAHSILHLVHDLPGALGKLHDALNTGGILVTSTVCIGDWNPLFRPLIGIMKLIGKAPHVSLLTEKSLTAEITNAGFEIIPQDRVAGGDAVFIVARKI